MLDSLKKIKTSFAPNTINAIFLVAGTCIGGGMLALPVVTSSAGFIPSTAIMILVWLAMTCTALYLVEVGFWMKKDDAHIITMSRTLLGKTGKAASWILYLFICYASLVAYIAGAGALISHGLEYLNCEISQPWGCVLLIVFLGPVLYVRHTTLGKINSCIFLFMIIAYFVLVALAFHRVEPEFLMRSSWKESYIAIPLLLSAFSFQTMVPSLHPFLNHHAPSLRLSIILGTAIAFIVYLVWQFVLLGTVPLEGPHGLKAALEQGTTATQSIGIVLDNAWIGITAGCFAFLALVTSFFGMSLGLYDFLSDGLNIAKKGWGNVLLGGLILLPCLFFAISLERIFVVALDASGGFGDSLLNGLIPIFMIWTGRYILKNSSPHYKVSGGKWLLVLAFCFYVFAFLVALYSHIENPSLPENIKELQAKQEVIGIGEYT